MKLRSTLVVLLAAGSLPVFAQKTITKSNVLFGPMFKTITTIQEVKLTKRLTTQTSVRTRPATEFSLFGLGKVNVDGQDYQPFGKTTLSGIGNITEFRIYGKEKGAFHGFYWGPYFSYMHYKLQSAAVRGEFHDANNVPYYADLHNVIKLGVTGGGIEIGTQGMYFNNHMAIDWTIFGVGMGWMKFEGGIEADNTSNNFDFRNYDDRDNVKLGIEKIFHFNRTIEPTSMTISAGIPWILFRTGVSVGFGYGANWTFHRNKDKKENGDQQQQQPQQQQNQNQQENKFR